MRHFSRFLGWIAALTLASTVAQAHEVEPAIADFTTENGQLRLEVTLAVEPLAAGVDLDGLADTNEAEQAERVDELRAMPPEVLLPELAELSPRVVDVLALQADGEPLTPVEIRYDVDPVGDVALPRDTIVTITGALPPGTKTLSLSWPREFGALVVRQQGVDDPYTGYLSGGQSTGPIDIAGTEPKSAVMALIDYIPVGFDHILPKGLDHILFVLGLFFLSTSLATLLWQVSAFTLAHTVTLALGALGYVNIPGSIVEPLIAASIVYVAVENVVSDKLQRWRPLVIFGFGLLHGLGFASVLGEFGLPADQFIPALIGFNIGVEIGQLTVIALAFLVVFVAQRVDRGETEETFGMIYYAVLTIVFVMLGVVLNGETFQHVMGASAGVFFWPVAGLTALCALSAYELDKLQAYRRFVAVPTSVAIALVGAYWFVERVFL